MTSSKEPCGDCKETQWSIIFHKHPTEKKTDLINCLMEDLGYSKVPAKMVVDVLMKREMLVYKTNKEDAVKAADKIASRSINFTLTKTLKNIFK